MTDEVVIEETTPELAQELIERVGCLTRTGRIDELVIARCECGFPAVLLPANMWGEVFGCAVCHTKTKAAIDKAREEEARAQRAKAADELRRKRDYEIYAQAHFEDLSKGDRKLFKNLYNLSPMGFNVGQVARVISDMTHTPYDFDEAWATVQRMLDANCLIEKWGRFQEVRPYSTDEIYASGACKDSTYRCRKSAVQQMLDLDEREAAQPPAPKAAPAPIVVKPGALAGDTVEGEVKTFVAKRCATGEGYAEHEIVMRAKYVAWAEGRQAEPINPQEFSDELERAGFSRRGGKWRGLRLKSGKELMADGR